MNPFKKLDLARRDGVKLTVVIECSDEDWAQHILERIHDDYDKYRTFLLDIVFPEKSKR